MNEYALIAFATPLVAVGLGYIAVRLHERAAPPVAATVKRPNSAEAWTPGAMAQLDTETIHALVRAAAARNLASRDLLIREGQPVPPLPVRAAATRRGYVGEPEAVSAG